MHSGTVVALVVVLADDLPVRGNFVADRLANPQLTQWVARGARGHGPELLLERDRPRRGEIEKHESTPAADPDRIEAELCLIETRLGAQVGCCEQPPVEIVAP